MKPRAMILVLAGLLALGLVSGPASPAAGQVSAKAKTKAPCYKASGGYAGRRYKPGKCTFKQRGEPFAGYSTADTRSMKWGSWRKGRAKGHGKTTISTYGPTPIRVTLLKASNGCFHKGIFAYPQLGTRGSIRLDGC